MCVFVCVCVCKAGGDVTLSLAAAFKMKRVALECLYGQAFREDRGRNRHPISHCRDLAAI